MATFKWFISALAQLHLMCYTYCHLEKQIKAAAHVAVSAGHCKVLKIINTYSLKEENPFLLKETECGARLDIGWPAVRILR